VLPNIEFCRARTGNKDLRQVTDELILGKCISPPVIQKPYTDSVIPKQVAGKSVCCVGLERRQVNIRATGTINDFVALNNQIRRFFETNTYPGRPRGVGNFIISYNDAVAVHQENTHRIIEEFIPVSQIVARIHKMEGITTVGGFVTGDCVIGGIPNYHVTNI